MRKPSQLAKWKLVKLLRRRDGSSWADLKDLGRQGLEAKCVGWHIVERLETAPFEMPTDTAHLCPCNAIANFQQGH